jgi:hypothetical protein
MAEIDTEENAQAEAAQTETEQDEKPLDKMTVKELRDIAKDIGGVVGVHAMKKEELLVVIKEARGIKEEKPRREKKKKVGEKIITVKDLKEKILKLREEKSAAREAGNAEMVNVCRRRINRLKKQTRKIVKG